MKRLSKPAAAILREEIKAGRLVYNLEAHLMLYGSCKTFEPKPAKLPTDAKPGSDEKIAVMRSRVELGQALVHPKDCRQPIAPTWKPTRYVCGIREIQVAVCVAELVESER